MNNKYFDILNQQYNSAKIRLVQTFNCFVGFAVLKLVGIIVIAGIQNVDMSVIYVPVNLISNGVEQAQTVSHENVSTAIIHGGFTFLKLFVCAGIVVCLFKLGNVCVQFNDGRKSASELVPATARFIFAFSLFFMIPMGENSALHLVNKYNLEIEHATHIDYPERLTTQFQAMRIGRKSNRYFPSRLTNLIWITLNQRPETRQALIVRCKIFNQANCICVITTVIFAH